MVVGCFPIFIKGFHLLHMQHIGGHARIWIILFWNCQLINVFVFFPISFPQIGLMNLLMLLKYRNHKRTCLKTATPNGPVGFGTRPPYLRFGRLSNMRVPRKEQSICQEVGVYICIPIYGVPHLACRILITQVHDGGSLQSHKLRLGMCLLAPCRNCNRFPNCLAWLAWVC